MKKSEPTIYFSVAMDMSLQKQFVKAARNGHLKVVKLLLEDPRVDPSNDHNREIVKLLLTDPRVYSNNKPIIAIESLKINVILLFLM